MGLRFFCRICPGRFLSNGSLNIFVATMLHTFNIKPGVDEDGRPLRLSTEMLNGLLTYVYHVMTYWYPPHVSSGLLVLRRANSNHVQRLQSDLFVLIVRCYPKVKIMIVLSLVVHYASVYHHFGKHGSLGKTCIYVRQSLDEYCRQNTHDRMKRVILLLCSLANIRSLSLTTMLCPGGRIEIDKRPKGADLVYQLPLQKSRF